MAVSDANKFLERLSTDASMRAEIQTAATLGEILDFALTRGFVFTEQDLKPALVHFPDNPAVDRMRDKLKIPHVAHPGRN